VGSEFEYEEVDPPPPPASDAVPMEWPSSDEENSRL